MGRKIVADRIAAILAESGRRTARDRLKQTISVFGRRGRVVATRNTTSSVFSPKKPAPPGGSVLLRSSAEVCPVLSGAGKRKGCGTTLPLCICIGICGLRLQSEARKSISST